MKKTINLFIILFLLSLSLLSCSDIKKQEIKKEKLQHSSFELTCKLDMDAIKHIMTQRINSELDCLEEHLLLVANVLKSGKPRAIGKQEFKTLLDKGIDGLVEDIDPDIIKSIDAIFELNFLIGSGDRNFVTDEQIKDLIIIVKSFNEQVIPVYADFKNKRKVPYQWHKARRLEYYSLTERMITPILGLFNQSRDKIDQVDLIAILNTFSSGDEDDTIEKLKKFLVVKKIILGGSVQKVSHLELFKLFEKLPALVGIAYDALKFSDIEFSEIIEQIDFANTALRDIGRDILVSGTSGNQKLFSIRELEIYFKRIYGKPLEIDFFQSQDFIFNVKQIFFGKGQYFTGVQLKNFISFAREMGYKFQYFLELYDIHSDLLDQPRGMDKLKFDRLAPRNKDESRFQKEFTEIFQKHLFFRKNNKPAHFKTKTRKTPRSVIEYAGYEMIAEKIMRYWETLNPCDGPGFTKETGCKKENYQGDLNPEQMRTLVRLGKDFLDKAGIIAEDKLDVTVDSIASLVDIFLHASDGNRQIDKYELSEFITMILSAIQMKDDVFERLKRTCSVDRKNNIEAKCFKENFFNEIFRKNEKLDYEEFFPLLKKYSQSISEQRNDLFMTSALGFARTCQKYTDQTLVPVGGGDILSILIGVLHIESLMIRFDLNQNNVLDIHELESAFSVFDKEIKAELPGGIFSFLKRWKSLKMKILWYLLTKRKVPSTGKGILLIFQKQNKDARKIDRADFVALLQTLANDGLPRGFDQCERPN